MLAQKVMKLANVGRFFGAGPRLTNGIPKVADEM